MESPTAHREAPPANLLVLYGVWHSVGLEVAIIFQSMIVGCNCSKVVEHGSKHLACVSNGQDCLYFYGFCPPMLVLANEGSAAIKWLIFFIVYLLCAAGLSEFSVVQFYIF